jgi:NADH-quinone oxidoreductase subunit A
VLGVFGFFVIIALGFCMFLLLLSWVLGGRATSKNKNTPFESGIISTGTAEVQFSAKFYLIAMFFVVFDVESLYLYAWSISIYESGWIGFYASAIFIFSIILALFYLNRIKALNLPS